MKKRLATGKDVSIDDPIRLYLREIGKERLLTADEETKYSKDLEEGYKQIVRVLKSSGMIIPEMSRIMQKVNSRNDPKELNFATKKELTEYMAEKKRLSHAYKPLFAKIGDDLRDYMERKRKVISRGGNILEDKELGRQRAKLLDVIKDAKLHENEVEAFAEKFINASEEIKKLQRNQDIVKKRLQVRSSKDIRAIGRSLTMKNEREELEKRLDMSSDEIKDKIRQVQTTQKQLATMEAEFEETIEGIDTLAREVKQGRDRMKTAKDKLIKANLRLVVSIA
jgi:RNA polymerase primary sigma factor